MTLKKIDHCHISQFPQLHLYEYGPVINRLIRGVEVWVGGGRGLDSAFKSDHWLDDNKS